VQYSKDGHSVYVLPTSMSALRLALTYVAHRGKYALKKAMARYLIGPFVPP